MPLSQAVRQMVRAQQPDEVVGVERQVQRVGDGIADLDRYRDHRQGHLCDRTDEDVGHLRLPGLEHPPHHVRVRRSRHDRIGRQAAEQGAGAVRTNQGDDGASQQPRKVDHLGMEAGEVAGAQPLRPGQLLEHVPADPDVLVDRDRQCPRGRDDRGPDRRELALRAVVGQVAGEHRERQQTAQDHRQQIAPNSPARAYRRSSGKGGLSHDGPVRIVHQALPPDLLYDRHAAVIVPQARRDCHVGRMSSMPDTRYSWRPAAPVRPTGSARRARPWRHALRVS